MTPGVHRLRGETQRHRARAAHVLHRGMEDRAAHAEVEAEDHTVLTDHPDDGRQIGERPEGLQADDDLARAAGEHLEGLSAVCAPASTMMAPGEAGLELRQLPEHRALNRAALDGVEVGDVAGPRAQAATEGLQQRDGVADDLRHERGGDRLVARAVSGLRPHRHALRQIEHGNDLHDLKLPVTEPR